jgi:XTP/dITP diphosphohydrolase
MARKFAGGRLVIATHNPGKVREIGDLLRPFAVEAVSAGSLHLPEPEETESTFEGNARIKAVSAARGSGLPSLADDSGFCVDALMGAPGVYSADWAGPRKDFGRAMAMVHEGLTLAKTPESRAHFVCVLAMAWPDGHVETFRGEVFGTTVWPPRGHRGFGYDPMFLPDGEALTFGEMEPGQKHAMSHRALAFDKLVKACFA